MGEASLSYSTAGPFHCLLAEEPTLPIPGMTDSGQTPGNGRSHYSGRIPELDRTLFQVFKKEGRSRPNVTKDLMRTSRTRLATFFRRPTPYFGTH